MKKLITAWGILITVLVVALAAQGTGTPNQLRVITDANGYLVASANAQTLPLSQPTLFSNTRLRTDSNGYLLIASSGVAGGSWTLITSATPTGVPTAEFTGLAAYSEVRILLKQITLSQAGTLAARVSVDNGSNYLSTSGDYVAILGVGSESNRTLMEFYDPGATAARSMEMSIEGFNLTTPPKTAHNSAFFSTDGRGLYYMPTTSALSAIRILNTGPGNFAAGTIYIYGR